LKQQPLPDAVGTCRQKHIEQQPLPWLELAEPVIDPVYYPVNPLLDVQP
jgi:hypothetical protein